MNWARPALGIAFLLMGCADRTSIRGPSANITSSPLELRDTPFFPQKAYQCGPAALATLLVYAGRETTPEELAGQVYLPGRKGSLQVELLGATRRHGLLPYPIEPTLDALVAELNSGRPVLVLQNLGLVGYPVWHYAVVIGYGPNAEQVFLRSGKIRREVISADRFLATWGRADRWGLVALSPGELPGRPDKSRYLEAVAALEAVGRFDAALAGYRSALEQWPQDATALLGIGNSLYRLGDLPGAEAAYQRLLDADPRSPVGYNNLAQVLADQGRYDRALTLISKGLSLRPLSSDLRQVLRKTEAEILRQAATSKSRAQLLPDPRIQPGITVPG